VTDQVHGDTCGCCSGTSAETPARIANAPGLSKIDYRVGRHSTFKESMLAKLSDRSVPALAGLGARTDDDPTIALIDGAAVMADVLTFYQERIANEAFLRTASERRSALELARLIGYQPDPGVAADAWLAFTLEQARGIRPPPTVPVIIPERTRVQSVPGPDEAPQTFETVAPIEARAERNAIAARTVAPQSIAFGQRELYLDGTGHQVVPGDIILVVGKERRDVPTSERWDLRLVRSVDEDDVRDVTRLRWREGLGSVIPHVEPAASDVSVHVFRQRAALFGHNAPHPWLLSSSGTGLSNLANLSDGTWKNFGLSGQSVDLDQAYPKVVPGGWLVLISDKIPHDPTASSLPGYAELYGIDTVSYPSVSAFGLAGKVTRVGLDTDERLVQYTRPDTLVLAQSEELPLAARPVRSPLYGDRIAMASVVPDLAKSQPLAVSGARQFLRMARDVGKLELDLDDGTAVPLAPGDRVALLEAPTRPDGQGGRSPVENEELTELIESRSSEVLRWRVADRSGQPGTVDLAPAAYVLDVASSDDRLLSEIVRIDDAADAVLHDRDRTTVRLAEPLSRAYDRRTVRVNANVASATHGETVSEILGSGDASVPNRRLPLSQGPLTWVGAPTATGRRSTIEVRVDDALWEERSTLYGAKPRDRIYTVRIGDDSATTVILGDGDEGARPPTGQANIRARYRKGLGADGNVRAGQLSTLITRPLGVEAVTNPEPASGGEDPESLDDVRRNAPRTVLTLERAVSRRDYEDFARGFAGIAKAHATWIASGTGRGIAITVAGPAGAPITPGDGTHGRLVDALRDQGDPLLPLTVRSFDGIGFRLAVTVKVDPAFEPERVLDAVRAGLLAAFAFDAREFGQSVSVDEVVSVIHRVAGVVAVDVDVLRRSDQPAVPPVRPRLTAALTRFDAGTIQPAELLTIDATTLSVEPMP
jgi:hypothetical protein